jgi:hypothetical protein
MEFIEIHLKAVNYAHVEVEFRGIQCNQGFASSSYDFFTICNKLENLGQMESSNQTTMSTPAESREIYTVITDFLNGLILLLLTSLRDFGSTQTQSQKY